MTAYERSGWRDQEISARHREWGVNCPAVDIDFMMVEYNAGLPVALIEYKRYSAPPVDLRHATYRALSKLADLAALPFAIAFYWPGSWVFRVEPANDAAVAIYGTGMTLPERRFVKSLYHLRQRAIEVHVLDRLSVKTLPEGETLPVVIRAPMHTAYVGRVLAHFAARL